MKIAYLDATWDVMLAAFMGHDAGVVTSTLPEDAKVSHMVLNHEQRMTRVFWTSDTLDDVPEGAPIPRVEPVLRWRAVAEAAPDRATGVTL